METKELELIGEEIKSLLPKLKDSLGKLEEERKLIGVSSEETKAEFKALHDQMDGLDLKFGKLKYGAMIDDAVEQKSVAQEITESPEFAEEIKSKWASLRTKNGRVIIPYNGRLLDRKSLITTTAGLTVATTGVQQITRLPGITSLASQDLRLRDLLPKINTTTGTFDYVKVLARTNNASPQVEGSAKAESTYTYSSVAGQVQEIAHFVNVTKQALADVPYLRNSLDTELLYGLKLQEESQLIFGDGVGSHIRGIWPDATQYDTATYNVANDTKLDKLRHAKLQARLIGLGTYVSDAYVLNPRDMHDIELIKDESGGVANKGKYVVGDPKTGPSMTLLWGLPVVESDSLNYQSFLCLCTMMLELVDRQEATIEISYEHSSNFTANLATIRAEERVGLANRFPTVQIKGSFA